MINFTRNDHFQNVISQYKQKLHARKLFLLAQCFFPRFYRTPKCYKSIIFLLSLNREGQGETYLMWSTLNLLKRNVYTPPTSFIKLYPIQILTEVSDVDISISHYNPFLWFCYWTRTGGKYILLNETHLKEEQEQSCKPFSLHKLIPCFKQCCRAAPI